MLPPPRGLQLLLQLPAAAAAPMWPVAFGSLSMQGRMNRMEDAVSLRSAFCTWLDGSPMHLFAVFDGHGGSHVSALCRNRMHKFLAEELKRERASFLVRREHAIGGGGGGAWMEQTEEELAWRAALVRAFRRIHMQTALLCACGRMGRPRCRFPRSIFSGMMGSTAVVAVLVRGHLVVANCGDSRAVLCRGDGGAPPIPLSDDHKIRVGFDILLI
ncbi:putative protein phosphatase 2C 37 [Dichanthelium oligosanthes]|uniref:protein-serine/threonine phosphatase n=1 Tax=Dichanthelium oligosanthes TaxID=888268 RepID=A0A1E5W4P1_9POAL|nr:putative protein phosphatase 2C 37 [Dichanthelium oligosanthes]